MKLNGDDDVDVDDEKSGHHVRLGLRAAGRSLNLRASWPAMNFPVAVQDHGWELSFGRLYPRLV